MSKAIVIFVCVSLVFAGLEGAAEAATFDDSGHDAGHELHGAGHTADHDHNHDHEHDGDEDHEGHFCHCSLHALALLYAPIKTSMPKTYIATGRYELRIPFRAPTPPLRPPTASHTSLV